MRALRRVLGAPGLVLAVVAVQLLVAVAVGSAVRSGVGAAMGPWTVLADGHLLYAVVRAPDRPPGAGGGRSGSSSPARRSSPWSSGR